MKIWVAGTNIGIKKIGMTVFFLSISWILGRQDMIPVITLIQIGLFALVLLLGRAIHTKGVYIQRHRFKTRGHEYEIVDHIYPTKPDSNTRGVYSKDGWSLSQIYMTPQPEWKFKQFGLLVKTMFKDKREALKTALVLGGGGASIPIDLMRTYKTIHVDIVEISTSMILITEKYFLSMVDNSRYKVHCQDAYDFILQTSHTYDLVFFDIPDHKEMSAKFSGEKFVGKLSKRISPRGVILINFGYKKVGDISRYVDAYKTNFRFFCVMMTAASLWGVASQKDCGAAVIRVGRRIL